MKTLQQSFFALVVAALFVTLSPPAAAQGWYSNSPRGSSTPSGSAGGDLAGTYPNPTVAQLTGSASTVTLVAGTSLGGAAGAGGLSLGSLTGATTLPTGNISWTGASTKTVSLVSTGAGSSITLTAGAASTWGTSAGALTLTSATGATWSATAGSLTLNGGGSGNGLNLQGNGATVADVGVTTANTVTLAANASIGGVAGTGALSLGSLTGATTLPTGNISWTGASGKTVSLVSTGASSSITLTAGAASTWSTSSGALTITSAAGATWSTSAGVLTLSGVGGTVVQGGASGVNVNITTTGTGSNVYTSANAHFFAGAPILPTSDSAVACGTSAFRWNGFATNTVGYNVYQSVSDGTATALMSDNSGGQILLGISSASGFGVRMRSTGTKNNLILDDSAGGALLNVQIGGTAAFGGGKGVLSLANANTNPTSNPSSALIEYASGGGLFTRGSGGAITQAGAAGVGTINTQTMTTGFETYALRTTTGAATTWATIALASSTCQQYIVQWTVRNTSAANAQSDTTEVTCCNNAGTATCSAGTALIATPIAIGAAVCPTAAPTVTGSQSGANAILQATCPGGSTVDWQFSLFTNTD